jgi:hypothetical protein
LEITLSLPNIEAKGGTTIKVVKQYNTVKMTAFSQKSFLLIFLQIIRLTINNNPPIRVIMVRNKKSMI